MKKFLEATIKVKHVLIALVLVIGMVIGFILNKPNHFRQRQMVQMERHVPQMRNHWDRQRPDFKKLSDVEKASVDSLRSLIKRGDWENNKIIFQQIREIVKGD